MRKKLASIVGRFIVGALSIASAVAAVDVLLSKFDSKHKPGTLIKELRDDPESAAVLMGLGGATVVLARPAEAAIVGTSRFVKRRTST